MASSTITTILLNPSPSRCTENLLDQSNTYSGGKALLLFGHLSAEIYLQFEPNNTKSRPILTQNSRLLIRNYSRFGVKADEFVAGNIETRFLQGTRLEGNDKSRHDLVKLIVDRVYVLDDKVVAMTLNSNYHLVLNHKTNGPTEFTVDPLGYTYGSDGGRPLTCIKLVVAFLPKYIVNQPLVFVWPAISKAEANLHA